MDTSAKYQANKILRTDRPHDQQADSSIPPTNFVCRGTNIHNNFYLIRDNRHHLSQFYIVVLTGLQYKSFENIVGKGEMGHNKQFPFPNVFSTHLESFLPFSSTLKLLSANSFSLKEPKICRL